MESTEKPSTSNYQMLVNFPYLEPDTTLIDNRETLSDVIYYSQEEISSRLIADVLKAHEKGGLPLSCFIGAMIKHLQPHATSEKARQALDALEGFYEAVFDVDRGFGQNRLVSQPIKPIKKDELLGQVSSDLLLIHGLAKAGVECAGESVEDEAIASVCEAIVQRAMETYNEIDRARLLIEQ